MQRLQFWLPLNPQSMGNVSPDSSFNTAVSFVANTSGQGYSGEQTMSDLTQMLGLAVQNFLSAATGIVEVIALIRGPVASQEAIKMLGTNGGGSFNANSAHPFENPTALTNFVQMISIFLIPAALCFSFGRLVQGRRQGWAIQISMSLLFAAGAIAAMSFEQQGNPAIAALGVDQGASSLQSGGNMEGTTPGVGLGLAICRAIVQAHGGSIHGETRPQGGAQFTVVLPRDVPLRWTASKTPRLPDPAALTRPHCKDALFTRPACQKTLVAYWPSALPHATPKVRPP